MGTVRVHTRGACGVTPEDAIPDRESSFGPPTPSTKGERGFDPDRFVAACGAAARSPDPRRAVGDLMRHTFTDPASVEAAFDNRVSRDTDPDEMALLFSDELSIFRVALDPGTLTPAHDHGLWTWVGVYRGQEDNILYRSNGDRLEVEATVPVRTGEVFEMAPDTIHAIHNPRSELSLSLHVYLGPLHTQPRSVWHPLTSKREPLDVPAFRRYERLLTRRKNSNPPMAAERGPTPEGGSTCPASKTSNGRSRATPSSTASSKAQATSTSS